MARGSYVVQACITGSILYIRDEHGSVLKQILAGSRLDRTAIFLKINGSGVDRTEKIFVVLM